MEFATRLRHFGRRTSYSLYPYDQQPREESLLMYVTLVVEDEINEPMKNL